MRRLPLVSGERKSDTVICIAPVQRLDLIKLARSFISKEANLTSSLLPIVGNHAKTATSKCVEYEEQGIAPPEEAITTLNNAG